MMEVEGGTEAWCMRLLRHAMGHVLNHAYLLEKDKAWQKLTGGAPAKAKDLFVKGRKLRVPRAAHGVARFTFKELCETPLGASDRRSE